MIGTTVGHYHIEMKLGEGGMGIVYRATDTELDRTVGLKFLPEHVAAGTQELERFVQEAKSAASLNHPNICTIHGIERSDGKSFIVMEYVEGKELLTLAGTLDEQATLRLIIQVCDGLSAAHAKGIVHRDIKSSNIMVAADGRVKIMDFGLAKSGNRSDLTSVGSTVGTLAYLSPEQARGETVDRRADIYAVGVVLFEVLTGKRPFNAAYEHALLYQILNERPEHPSALAEGISSAADAIVGRCLEKDPERRYQSIEELREDLNSALSGRTVATQDKSDDAEHATHPVTRRWMVLVLSLLLVVALVTALGPADVWDRFAAMFGEGVPDEKHLAVLPFAYIGADPARQTLCDGLTETMTSQLTQLEQFHGSLWVVPATEIRRGNVASVEDARKAFGVNLAVYGSLQVIGKRYRLSLNLVDAGTLRQLGSTSIDSEEEDLSSLHDGSVIQVLQMLHVEMHPETRGILQTGGTNVPEAYEFFLRGRGALLRYESEENIDEAILSFRQAIIADSAFALAHAALGEAFWRKYESGKDTRWVEQAILSCERAMAIDKDLAPVNVTLGIVFAGTGRPEKAIPLFERALTIDPAHSEAYRGLAKAYESAGEAPRAEQTYRRAIELRPAYWAGYNDLGVYYFRNSRYDDAIVAFRDVTRLTPDNYRGFNNLGGIYYMLQRWKEAREMFERSYAIRPSYRTASNLGTLNYVEGKYSDAVRWYTEAMKHNENDHVVMGNLASAYYWRDGGGEEARSSFRRAIALAEKQLEVNTGDAEVLALLGGYHAMIADSAKAVSYARRSLRANPTDASIMFRAGTTFERVGDRNTALEWIGRSIKAGHSISEISNQPELRSLYEDPRYTMLVAGKGN